MNKFFKLSVGKKINIFYLVKRFKSTAAYLPNLKDSINYLILCLRATNQKFLVRYIVSRRQIRILKVINFFILYFLSRHLSSGLHSHHHILKHIFWLLLCRPLAGLNCQKFIKRCKSLNFVIHQQTHRWVAGS